MNTQHPKEVISRKEALQRMGKYAALTAMGTFIILNPKTAQAQSPGNRPEGGDNFREPSASGSSGNKGNGLGQGNAYKDKDKTNPKFFTDNDIWN
ncbi:hypothetical protein ES711_04810 [Gelidibacter salicanalis]|uniref:Uncharacterized protein n=1 Tax=Gelidibacter salicanalis TaxID=291193 RepID=A0A5C7ATT5_9FLAO|nr:hypothetical protein [Gelidibacter salicanalis]TXE09252.1 hypothetical protein ES711_04810 [Gelidibacter salicanalis]